MIARLTRPIAFTLVAILVLVASLPAGAVTAAGPLAGAGLWSWSNWQVSKPLAGGVPLAGRIICLDPGHGGVDSGAYNTTYDLRESDINLDEAHALRALLEGSGATVVMTRAGNQAMTESGRAVFCNQAGATILIALHTNSVADTDPNGALMLAYKTADYPLAQALYDSMYATLQPSAPAPLAFFEYGVRRFRAGVLRRSTMPGTVSEPAFLSNPGEARLLDTAIYTAPGSGVLAPGCPALSCRRGQIALALYRGVLAYFASAGSG